MRKNVNGEDCVERFRYRKKSEKDERKNGTQKKSSVFKKMI